MIKVNVSEIMQLENDLKQLAGSVLGRHLDQGAHIAGAEIQSEARHLVPVDLGALRISIENSASQVPGGINVTVGPTQPYGREIEFGRPPGTYVSPAALAGWAKRKGLNPYAVSKSIQRHGSPAQPYMFPAFYIKLAAIPRILGQAMENAFKEVFAHKTS